jgi:hypothetical protein
MAPGVVVIRACGAFRREIGKHVQRRDIHKV